NRDYRALADQHRSRKDERFCDAKTGEGEMSHLSDELLALAAGGDTAPEEKARVTGHLAVCSACRAKLAEFESMSEWLRAAAPEPDIVDRQLVRAAVRVRIGQNRRRSVWRWAAVATAGALAAVCPFVLRRT